MKLSLVFLLTTFLGLFSSSFYADNTKSLTSEYVDIGQGRKIYLECHGAGSPTVILISGLDDRADVWHESNIKQEPDVFSETSTFTRVCAYDRPGTIINTDTDIKKSRSDPVHQPITIQQAAKDLHDLLVASHQPGPFVLVGHSAGGLIARAYGATYPKKVAGIVLVDALSENLHQQLSPDDWYFFDTDLNGVPKELASYSDYERIDYVTSFGQLKPIERDIPIIVLSAGKMIDTEGLESSGRLKNMPTGFLKRLWAAQLKAQNHLAQLFPGAKHIWQNNSSHYIHVEQPQIVSQSIREIVEQVRKQAQSQ
jgi:pimeloyl-ACP methyl ester carboxylesterase